MALARDALDRGLWGHDLSLDAQCAQRQRKGRRWAIALYEAIFGIVTAIESSQGFISTYFLFIASLLYPNSFSII